MWIATWLDNNKTIADEHNIKQLTVNDQKRNYISTILEKHIHRQQCQLRLQRSDHEIHCRLQIQRKIFNRSVKYETGDAKNTKTLENACHIKNRRATKVMNRLVKCMIVALWKH
jgi:hypothetical protein